jgi:hypothetical protein
MRFLFHLDHFIFFNQFSIRIKVGGQGDEISKQAKIDQDKEYGENPAALIQWPHFIKSY